MLPPLVERELRLALRRKATDHWLASVWITGVLTGIFLFWLSEGNAKANAEPLFRWVFGIQLAIIVGRSLTLTADLFSEERRNGTLGLLVLTGMRPLEIFANKLLGAVMVTAYSMIGCFPFLAVAFLSGGVSGIQFVAALVSLVNVLLFCVAIGLLASICNREGGRAQAIAVAVVAVLSLTTPAVVLISDTLFPQANVSNTWLILSPAYAPFLALTAFVWGSVELFWMCAGVTLVYSLTAIASAGYILLRTWRDAPQVAEATAKTRWPDWLRGNVARRRQLRRHMLDDEPFCWLAMRERRHAMAAAGLVVSVAVLWMIGYLIRDDLRISALTLSIGASLLMHYGVNCCLAYAAAARLSEERQTGGFEVLLTTPLSVEAIVKDQQRAVWIRFKYILFTVLAMDVVFALFAWNARSLYPMGWLLWIGAWFIAHRITVLMAMWVGAWTGRPAYAAWKAVRPGMLLALTLMPFKSPRALARKLESELRQIACAPIPTRGDSHFENWNPEIVFAPGRWGDFKLHPASSSTPAATRGLRRRRTASARSSASRNLPR